MFTNRKKVTEKLEGDFRISATTELRELQDGSLSECFKKNFEKKFGKINELEKYVVPNIFDGRNVVCKSPVGFGKSTSFVIAGILEILRRSQKVIFICPTKIKAEFIKKLCFDLTKDLEIKYNKELYKGRTFSIAYDNLGYRDYKNVDILIVSLNYLTENLENKTINLETKTILFFVDLGKLHNSETNKQIEILNRFINKNVQICISIFSYNRNIENLISNVLHKTDKELECFLGFEIYKKNNINHEIFYNVDPVDKICQIIKNLTFVASWREAQEIDRVVIFVEKENDCKILQKNLDYRNYKTTILYNDKKDLEKNQCYKKFRTGISPILITTGFAAKYLDIDVSLVINYDLPNNISKYLQRCNRTKNVVSFFYWETNSLLVPDLINLIKENNQVVPDFLYNKPERNELININIPRNKERNKSFGKYKNDNKSYARKYAKDKKIEDSNIEKEMSVKVSPADSEDEELGVW